MLRGLVHFWRVHLAVVLACAVATAVLTGALIVGDSVKGSLRQLTLERLGEIDHSLVSRTFFRQALAERLSEALGEDSETAAAIITQGSAVHTQSRARASRVSIQGVNHDFLRFFPDSQANDNRGVHPTFRSRQTSCHDFLCSVHQVRLFNGRTGSVRACRTSW